MAAVGLLSPRSTSEIMDRLTPARPARPSSVSPRFVRNPRRRAASRASTSDSPRSIMSEYNSNMVESSRRSSIHGGRHGHRVRRPGPQPRFARRVEQQQPATAVLLRRRPRTGRPPLRLPFARPSTGRNGLSGRASSPCCCSRGFLHRLRVHAPAQEQRGCRVVQVVIPRGREHEDISGVVQDRETELPRRYLLRASVNSHCRVR